MFRPPTRHPWSDRPTALTKCACCLLQWEDAAPGTNNEECINAQGEVCSGPDHGDCVGNACQCNVGWEGEFCQIKVCPDRCSGNGECFNGVCTCFEGWSG